VSRRWWRRWNHPRPGTRVIMPPPGFIHLAERRKKELSNKRQKMGSEKRSASGDVHPRFDRFRRPGRPAGPWAATLSPAHAAGFPALHAAVFFSVFVSLILADICPRGLYGRPPPPPIAGVRDYLKNICCRSRTFDVWTASPHARPNVGAQRMRMRRSLTTRKGGKRGRGEERKDGSYPPTLLPSGGEEG